MVQAQQQQQQQQEEGENSVEQQHHPGAEEVVDVDDETPENNEDDDGDDDDVRARISKKLPIRMTSRVIRGFGRGSKDLGIPTANLDTTTTSTSSTTTTTEPDACCKIFAQGVPTSLEDLPCGIYWGFCRIGEKNDSDNNNDNNSDEWKKNNNNNNVLGITMKCALSIGYNPTYGNAQKTVEPHLIASASDPRRHASSCQETLLMDLYGQPCRLSVVGYLRPELPFEGLEKLVVAIKQDIVHAEQLADQTDDAKIQAEREWVNSTESLL